MNRFLLPAGIFAALVALLFIGIQRAPNKSVIASPLIDKPAPQFELPVLNSTETFSNESMRGRWYLLNVWGTWCAECRREHDMLLEIAAQGEIPIVGLNWKDDPGAAQQWLEQLGNPYAVIPADREGRVAIDWGVYGAPETFLIDDRGIVRYKHVGALHPLAWESEFLPRIRGVK
jgi:cytochrome c biogenesis protein CcmG, thiol:disulfide interchange protein DsbE